MAEHQRYEHLAQHHVWNAHRLTIIGFQICQSCLELLLVSLTLFRPFPQWIVIMCEKGEWIRKGKMECQTFKFMASFKVVL